MQTRQLSSFFRLFLFTFLTTFLFLSFKTKAQQCWKAISPLYGHSIGIDMSNRLWGWGLDSYGVLGGQSGNQLTIPHQIGTDDNWQIVSTGSNHALALKTDGTLWAWGSYDGYDRQSSLPVQITGDNNWRSISAGWMFSTAIKFDGTLWSWGYNNHGQLGNGTTTNISLPAQVGAENDWQYVIASYLCTLAIKTDGTLWAWGNNQYGQLGDGTFTDKYAPVQIGTGTNWKSISANYFHCLSLKTDGTLWAWGYNPNGQLGDGTNIWRNTPIQIGNDIDWKDISSGSDHSVAVKINGTLWAWGNNQFGQLGKGYGDYINYYSPAQSGTETNWKKAFAGDKCSYAEKNGSSIWAWGINQNGELCNGSRTVDNVLPETIICPPSVLPVSLLSFTAQKQTTVVDLNWQTATETNFANFELERSHNANYFEKIGSIISDGNSSLAKNYTFTDVAPYNGVNYYRLKQIDKNGSYAYSKTLIIHFDKKNSLIFPNPAYSSIVIDAAAGLKGIEIVNAVGVIVKNVAPSQNHRYDVSSLPKGTYVVKLFYTDKYEILKLIKL